MREVCLIDGVRTPFTRMGTTQAGATAVELGRVAVMELMVRTGIDPARIDEVVVGNVIQPVDAVNIARVIALRAQLPRSIPAYTVHRNCASGIQAIAEAHMLIASGRAECVIAAGVESMSNAPLNAKPEMKAWLEGMQKMRTATEKVRHIARFPLGQVSPDVGLLLGLTDPVVSMNMGQTAEKLAREFTISRAEQDSMAVESHRRAAAAWASGWMKGEVISTFPPPRYEAVATDNGIREDSSMEKLAKLKPVFDRETGTVTAGNSSQITDGGCALLLMSQALADELDLRPMGKITDFAFAGLDPSRMGLGPVFAIQRLFDKHRMGWRDVDLIEMNEAFASQAIACQKAFESKSFYAAELPGSTAPGMPDWARTNVNGGAIALGHPVGATGARIVLTLMRELNRKGGGRGIATLCVGGGQGAAVLVEANA